MYFSQPSQIELLRSKISLALLHALSQTNALDIPADSHLTKQKIREVAENPLGTAAPLLIETLKHFQMSALLEEVLVSQAGAMPTLRKK